MLSVELPYADFFQLKIYVNTGEHFSPVICGRGIEVYTSLGEGKSWRDDVDVYSYVVDMIFTLKNHLVSEQAAKDILLHSTAASMGKYNLYNMSIDIRVIPPGFPFTKGRIFANLTGTHKKDLWGNGYIDMEVKEINVRRRRRKGNKTVTP
ncbi:hypothetical protein ACJJTC_018427 [Scirpophaga incertulas]